jgi:segregation and condensation protein A
VKEAGPVNEDEATDGLSAPHDAFRIALPNFEGPLDLLLHLIREHRVDILDIPIALITEKYLGHLERMKEINLDIAGEFLVMASTLLQLKSRLLLPKEEVPPLEGELAVDPTDPRAELVRRLLEYQKYRHAADQLLGADLLDRDVFARRVSNDRVALDPEEIGFKEISVYKLIEALDRVLKSLEPRLVHEVMRDRLSLSDAIHAIADKLRAAGPVKFLDLFTGQRTRSAVVVTFLALLEMAKLRLIRIFQAEGEAEILVQAKGEALTTVQEKAPEGLDEYQ